MWVRCRCCDLLQPHGKVSRAETGVVGVAGVMFRLLDRQTLLPIDLDSSADSDAATAAGLGPNATTRAAAVTTDPSRARAFSAIRHIGWPALGSRRASVIPLRLVGLGFSW
jgi:hypothetical protein